MTIVLASTSAIRKTLLAGAGVDFICLAPAVNEAALIRSHPAWTPEQTSQELAQAKALSLSDQLPHSLIVGADQVLVFQNKIFSKPRDIEQCREYLSQMRGKTHQLISSICFAKNGKSLWSFSDTASLTMRQFSDDYLDSYLSISGADCLSSAGGYKIEFLGVQLFQSFDGDYFTILGLPLLPLLGFLRQIGELKS